MDSSGIKKVYESSIAARNFIRLLIVIDVFAVLVLDALKSGLFDTINNAMFWSTVIIFFVHRENFRSGMRNFTGMKGWETNRSEFEGSQLSKLKEVGHEW